MIIFNFHAVLCVASGIYNRVSNINFVYFLLNDFFLKFRPKFNFSKNYFLNFD